MNVKVTDTGTWPAALQDCNVMEHLLLTGDMPAILEVYRDAAISYVERYTNVPIINKTVEQKYSLSDAVWTDGTDYTFQLKYRTDSDTAITKVYEDGILLPAERAELDNWKTINEVTIKDVAEGTEEILVEYEVVAERVPLALYSAVLIMIAEYWETRSITDSRRILNIRHIMNPYRIYML